MTKILLIGYNLPQIVPKVKIEAAHYRTWQFLQPLLDDGHTVCLCAGTRDEVAGADDVPGAWRAQLAYHPIAFGAGEWVGIVVQRSVSSAGSRSDELHPTAGVSADGSHPGAIVRGPHLQRAAGPSNGNGQAGSRLQFRSAPAG